MFPAKLKVIGDTETHFFHCVEEACKWLEAEHPYGAGAWERTGQCNPARKWKKRRRQKPRHPSRAQSRKDQLQALEEVSNIPRTESPAPKDSSSEGGTHSDTGSEHSSPGSERRAGKFVT